MNDTKIDFAMLKLINSKFKNEIESTTNKVLDQLDRQRNDIGYQDIIDTFISLINYLQKQVDHIKKTYKFITAKTTTQATARKTPTITKYSPKTSTIQKKKHSQFKDLHNQLKYMYLLKVIKEVIAIAGVSFKIPKDKIITFSRN